MAAKKKKKEESEDEAESDNDNFTPLTDLKNFWSKTIGKLNSKSTPK